MLDWLRHLDLGVAWKRWTNERVWRHWWKPPPLKWWYTPSGVGPGPHKPIEFIGAPIIAHTLFGVHSFLLAYLVTWVVLHDGNVLLGYAWSVAASGYGQIQKADALVPTGYNVQNMVWRTLITAVTVPMWAWVL